MADNATCLCTHLRKRHSIGADKGALCEDCDECLGFEAAAFCDRCKHASMDPEDFGRRCKLGLGTWQPCRGWMSDPRPGTAKAPKREDGLYWYVQEKNGIGSRHKTLVAAADLKEARAKYGYTREQHTSVRVHRASINEVKALGRTQ